MRSPAARISDMHSCPLINPGPAPHVGGPVTTGCPTVLVGGLPSARVSDIATCAGPPDTIVKGSMSVMCGGSAAARIGDTTAHGGVISSGCVTVLIGDTSGTVGGGAVQTAAGGAVAGLSQQANALLSAQETATPFIQQCEESDY